MNQRKNMKSIKKIDTIAISTLGGYRSKAGTFVGRNMFGYGAQIVITLLT